MTTTTETTTDTAEDLDRIFSEAFASMLDEVLHAPIVDLPIVGPVIPFPSPFDADA